MLPIFWALRSVALITFLVLHTFGRPVELYYSDEYGMEDENESDETFVSNDANEQDEYGEFVEGDMIFSNERTGLLNPGWPNAIVVYQIFGEFTPSENDMIQKGMGTIENKTCIRFRERHGEEKAYVNITRDGEGCYATVGFKGSMQKLNLNPSCFRKIGKIMHEMLHSLGFVHEHTRPDRDDWVTINLSNVNQIRHHNFQKTSWEAVTAFNENYDYDSVMHYTTHAFAVDKNVATITPKELGVTIGQRDYLSVTDVRKLNKMYKCTYREDAS